MLVTNSCYVIGVCRCQYQLYITHLTREGLAIDTVGSVKWLTFSFPISKIDEFRIFLDIKEQSMYYRTRNTWVY